MPGVGFRVCSIVWRRSLEEVFDILHGVIPPNGNDGEADDHADVRDMMRTSVKSAILSETEERAIGIEGFLQQRFEVALKVYNKRSGGKLMKALCGDISRGNNVDDGLLMDAVRKKSYRWFWFFQYTPNVCRVLIDLEGFGEFRCEIETMRMAEVETNLSLSFISSVKIGTILSHDHRVNPYKPWIRHGDWSADAKWKVAKLDLPEEASKQIATTMRWMFWSDFLE